VAEPEDIDEIKDELDGDIELEPVSDSLEVSKLEDVVVDHYGDDRLSLKADRTVDLKSRLEEPLEETEDEARIGQFEWEENTRSVLQEVYTDTEGNIDDEKVEEELTKHRENIKSIEQASVPFLDGMINQRLLIDAPTAFMFQVALEAEIAASEKSENLADNVIDFFKRPGSEALVEAEALVKSRVIQEDGSFTTTPFRKERQTFDLPGEAIDFELTPEAVDIATTAVAAPVGVKGAIATAKAFSQVGSKLGTPGKVIFGLGGAALGGIGGFSVTKIGTNIIATDRYGYEGGPENDLLGVRRSSELLFDFAKALNSSLGVLNNLSDWFQVSSLEARSAFISKAVVAADQFDVSDKVGNSKAVSDFLEWAKDQPDFTETLTAFAQGGVAPQLLKNKRALAAILSHPYVSDSINEQMKALTEVEKLAVETVLPINEEGEKTIHQHFADIVIEIHDALGQSPKFREASNLARQKEIKDLSVQLSKESRTGEPEAQDWPIIQYFEDIDLGVTSPSKKQIEVFVNESIGNFTYNDLPPDLKGREPDVDQFIEFIKLDISLGGQETYGSVVLDAAIESIQNEDSKESIQKLLNAMPIGWINQLKSSKEDGIYRPPSTEATAKWARSTKKYLEKTRGRKFTREVQRDLMPGFMSKVSSLHYRPSLWVELLQWSAIGPTTGAEQDAAINFEEYPLLLPIIEKLGLPTVMGTPAGVDLTAGDGIRNPMSTAGQRIAARRKSGTGGFQLGYEEIMSARGFSRDSWQFNLAQNIGMLMDIYNGEKFVGRAISNVGRLGLNAYPAVSTFKANAPGARGALAKRRLLAHTDFDKSADPIVQVHKMHKQSAQAELNEGRNPLDSLDIAERQQAEDIMLAGDLNPDQVFAAFEQAAQVTKKARRTSEKIIRSVDTNDVIALKTTPEYQSVLSDINRLVESGQIEADDAARFMAHIEFQALRVADAVDTPYASAREVLSGLSVTTGRPAGNVDGVVIRLIEAGDPDTSIRRKQGIPLGYFEYDERTRSAVINLFEGGDLSTLWQSNGHFMANLMGREFTDKLIRYFDNELAEDGTRRLTDTGNMQLADAWSHYRRVRDNPNGFVRRLMEEAWFSLHNFWSRLRKKPGLLPDEVRQYWDLEFGELPKDRRLVQSVSSAALHRRPRTNMLASTPEGRILTSPDADRARKRVATDLGYDSETIHSLLGHRKQTRVTVAKDSKTGQPKRVVERDYAPREYDAIDAGLEIIALIKTGSFRKSLSKDLVPLKSSPLKSIGTGRYHVPVSTLASIVEKTTNRWVDALGVDPASIKVHSPGRNGVNALTDKSTIPDGVTMSDINALRSRTRAKYIETAEQSDERVRGMSFVVLNDRSKAGLKTLIQEISNQPEADLIPFSLLDPDANLRLLTTDEFNRIRDVLTDIAATPLNRRSRNTVHPGYLMSMGQFLANRERTEGMGEVLKSISEFFGREKDIPDNYADPHFLEILDGGGRELNAAGDSLKKLINDPKLKDIDTVLGFFEHDMSLQTPKVNLSHVRRLFGIVGMLDGAIKKMETIADQRLAYEMRSSKSDDSVRPIYDPMDLDSPEVTFGQIARNITVIQELLDGIHGMTAIERESINHIRVFNDRLVAGDAVDLTRAERSSIADAVQVIHEGLKEKQQYVESFADRVFELILSVKQVSEADVNTPIRIDIYNKFYTGDIEGLLDIDTTKKLRRLPGAQRAPRKVFANKKNSLTLSIIEKGIQLVGKQFGAKYSTKLKDLNQSLISLMLMLKIDDVMFGIARNLAEEGYDLSRRSVTNNLDLKGEMNLSRSKYVDRVIYYIDQALAKSDEVAIFKDKDKGRRVRVPKKPPQEMYGPLERSDAATKTRVDKEAKYEAGQILRRAGIRIEDGTAGTILIGDKQFILPKVMIDQMESWVQDTYPQVRMKMNWGRTGRAEYRFESKDGVSQVSESINQQISNVANNTKTILGLAISPRTFYTGLLIGTGGLPMVGYGIGVFIGGLSQIHLGHGAVAAARDFMEAPATGARLASEVTPLVRNLAEAADAEIPFVAGVLARLFRNGEQRPRTKPYVTPDGRIYTADMIAETVEYHGWKSAFADVLANEQLYDAFYERFNKANISWINGAMFAAVGLAGGPQSALISGAFGASLAWALKPGNIFSKAHRFYRETFVAIDTMLRIKVLKRELDKGVSLGEAAKKTRNIMMDYSDLSEAERSYIKQYFAFYTYFTQANKLLFRSIVENPDRVVTQMKLARATQLKVTESKDPDLMLSKWDAYRTFLPFEIMGQKFRMPFLLTGDSVGLLLEMFVSVFGQGKAARDARVGMFGRADPRIGLAAAMVFDVDPGLGFPLERATLQVPAELIELDYELTGGALREYLGVKYIEPENIRYIYDEKEKRRVNERNIEMPNKGIWVATNTYRYLFVMEYLQTPITGRMGDNLWALSRANAGIIEPALDGIKAIKMLLGGRPLLSHVGALRTFGFVKGEYERAVVDDQGMSIQMLDPEHPTMASYDDIEDVRLSGQHVTATPSTLKKFGVAYKSKDGDTYTVYADQFYPTELGRAIGFSMAAENDFSKSAYWKTIPYIKKSKKATEQAKVVTGQLKEAREYDESQKNKDIDGE